MLRKNRSAPGTSVTAERSGSFQIDCEQVWDSEVYLKIRRILAESRFPGIQNDRNWPLRQQTVAPRH